MAWRRTEAGASPPVLPFPLLEHFTRDQRRFNRPRLAALQVVGELRQQLLERVADPNPSLVVRVPGVDHRVGIRVVVAQPNPVERQWYPGGPPARITLVLRMQVLSDPALLDL